jgi:hypothetical protein
MISYRQALDETDIGKSARVGYQSSRFIDLAFGGNPVLPTFEPKETEDTERNRYLWWKVADEKASTPPLDDVKAEVIQAWKMIEARKLAKAKADELAEQVRNAGAPMRDVLAGRDVATAGPFSWLDRDLGMIPQISKVSGVDDPSFEFMREVFSLEPGEVGVAPNMPQNIYYVVQVEKYEPSRDELENGFMTAMANPFLAHTYATVAAFDHLSDQTKWAQELQGLFDFQVAPGGELLRRSEEE